MDEINKELEGYSALTHGFIAAAYALTIPYHFNRKSWRYVAGHLVLAGYHIHSVHKHFKRLV